MKILTFANPKGGAGKTVSSINFAYALSRLGYKTLLIDTDPRGGVSICLGMENENTLFDLIKEYNEGFVEDVEKYINHKNGVDVVISDYEIAKFDSYFDAVTGQYQVKQYTGDETRTRITKWTTPDWVVEVQKRGAGEIVLNMMNQDGVRQGYDLTQLKLIRDLCKVPLIASGGAGEMVHFRDAFQIADVDGALAASVFHKGIIPIPELKAYLRNEGVQIRD